jgi:hypothetical protein
MKGKKYLSLFNYVFDIYRILKFHQYLYLLHPECHPPRHLGFTLLFSHPHPYPYFIPEHGMMTASELESWFIPQPLSGYYFQEY